MRFKKMYKAYLKVLLTVYITSNFITTTTAFNTNRLCSENQVERINNSRSVCCFTRTCDRNHYFEECQTDNGWDKCVRCLSGEINKSQFDTKHFVASSIQCEVPNCECFEEAFLFNKEECNATGKKICMCNRAKLNFGTDPNNCKTASIPCNRIGIELKMNGTCGPCDHGYEKTRADNSTCVPKSTSSTKELNTSKTDIITDTPGKNSTVDPNHDGAGFNYITVVIPLVVIFAIVILILIICAISKYRKRARTSGQSSDSKHSKNTSPSNHTLQNTSQNSIIPSQSDEATASPESQPLLEVSLIPADNDTDKSLDECAESSSSSGDPLSQMSSCPKEIMVDSGNGESLPKHVKVLKTNNRNSASKSKSSFHASPKDSIDNQTENSHNSESSIGKSNQKDKQTSGFKVDNSTITGNCLNMNQITVNGDFIVHVNTKGNDKKNDDSDKQCNFKHANKDTFASNECSDSVNKTSPYSDVTSPVSSDNDITEPKTLAFENSELSQGYGEGGYSGQPAEALQNGSVVKSIDSSGQLANTLQNGSVDESIEISHPYGDRPVGVTRGQQQRHFPDERLNNQVVQPNNTNTDGQMYVNGRLFDPPQGDPLTGNLNNCPSLNLDSVTQDSGGTS